ncbi:uncharacterized protein LOC123920795 isoform X1 [Trifolium pratense]|uniref:uncharacterized protein LOC123920795 isoform X1 n=1 Tax=Trifolium pratense TaxID=57577 RepID=UPI001E697B81|nr:uncharacterized protein LOC123920795 isoform X1 [Trifolium pratense]
MDRLAPPLLWTAEDDFLLKNAIENGASLQSLAKGAVSFSRRYSFTELRERWRSMLFDPDVAKEAAASMAKFEIAKYKAKKIKKAASKDVVPKRKAQNIRRHYYAMRKRIRKEASFMNKDEKDETDTVKQSDGDVMSSHDSFAKLEVNSSSSGINQGDSTFVFDCGNEAQSSGAAKGSHP